MKKITTEKFIEKAKKIHGDKYDYSKVNYINVKTKITVICPIHGEFETTPDNHINGKTGCPKCSGVYNYTSEEWINECKIKHNNKYDYSKVEYKNAKSKVKIICHEKDEFGVEHGEFEIRASNHISGIGCPKCGKRINYTQDDFIKKSQLTHGDKYDYSEVEYVNAKQKVKIICHEKDESGKEHGEFYQSPSAHISGAGCPKCNLGVKSNVNDFIKKSKQIHGEKYDYSKVNYINARKKVIITCPRHGDFEQLVTHHLKGCGCPKCKSSKLENIIINTLNKLNINYIYQSKILNLGNQTVDFYLPDKEIIIECQGEQHFTGVKFSNSQTQDEIEYAYKQQQIKDENKYYTAKKLGLEIIYFTIPKYFIQKDINIYQDFYKNKILLTDKFKLENLLRNDTNVYSITNNIYLNLNQKLNNIGVVHDDALHIKNFVIKYVDYDENCEQSAIDYYNNYKKNNYTPIIIFPDEFHYKHNIVVNKLKHIINSEDNYQLPKIYGRHCEIKEVDFEIVKPFLEKYHIQGSAIGTVHLGAYYNNNNLIGVMSFLKEDKNGNWNLTRFATDINYICCGVGGKLFKYFIKNYNYKQIKSFADRRWTINENDNIYTKLGFKLDSIICKDYRYYNLQVDKYQRYHKFGFRKNILNKKYGLPLTMTENEMTQQLGYKKIYDCGLFKYVYKSIN